MIKLGKNCFFQWRSKYKLRLFQFQENGRLFLPQKFHFAIAVMLVEVYGSCVPDGPGGLKNLEYETTGGIISQVGMIFSYIMFRRRFEKVFSSRTHWRRINGFLMRHMQASVRIFKDCRSLSTSLGVWESKLHNCIEFMNFIAELLIGSSKCETNVVRACSLLRLNQISK